MVKLLLFLLDIGTGGLGSLSHYIERPTSSAKWSGADDKTVFLAFDPHLKTHCWDPEHKIGSTSTLWFSLYTVTVLLQELKKTLLPENITQFVSLCENTRSVYLNCNIQDWSKTSSKNCIYKFNLRSHVLGYSEKNVAYTTLEDFTFLFLVQRV